MEGSLIAPEDVDRSWVPLFARVVDALERARWGSEELGEPVSDDWAGVLALSVTFTATGFGHYYLGAAHRWEPRPLAFPWTDSLQQSRG